MKDIVQKVIAAGVVLYDGRILIIQRAKDDDVFPNLWEIPSGKKEPLEKIEDTVNREVKEEVGIDVKVVGFVSVFNFQVEKENEIRDATQINFLVSPLGKPEVKLSAEHQDFAWVKEDEVDKYNLSKETKEVVKKAFKS